MYERVMEKMDKTCKTVRASGRLFMYAEDWVYAPAIAKVVEVLKATQDKILFMKGEESHSGSHAAHAAQWAMTGGGSLIRMGCHPLSAVLYLTRDTHHLIRSTAADGYRAQVRRIEPPGRVSALHPSDEDWDNRAISRPPLSPARGAMLRVPSARRCRAA